MDNGAFSYCRYLEGDDEGIAEVVRDYKDGLILYLQGFVQNLYTAEELAEDTFFRLMVKKPKFAGKSSFRSWLYGIGRHTALDHLRKSAKQSPVPIEDMEGYLADETDLERSYIREERMITVHRALAKLPAEYQQVLWLVYFEGFSHEDTQEAMHKSPRQIRNLLYRAKQSLRTELEKEGFEYEEL